MNKATKAVMAGIILAALSAADPAQAYDGSESCFTQRTLSGYVRICGEDDGGYAFSIRGFGEDPRRVNYRVDDDDDDDEPAVRTVVHHYYGPPAHGHHKCKGKGKGKGHDHHDHSYYHEPVYYYGPVYPVSVRRAVYWPYQ